MSEVLLTSSSRRAVGGGSASRLGRRLERPSARIAPTPDLAPLPTCLLLAACRSRASTAVDAVTMLAEKDPGLGLPSLCQERDEILRLLAHRGSQRGIRHATLPSCV